jgi:hypothetical protein
MLITARSVLLKVVNAAAVAVAASALMWLGVGDDATYTSCFSCAEGNDDNDAPGAVGSLASLCNAVASAESC